MGSVYINISKENNDFLDRIQKKYKLKNKDEVIKFLIENDRDFYLENVLNKNYIKKVNKIKEEKFTSYNSMKDLEDEFKNE